MLVVGSLIFGLSKQRQWYSDLNVRILVLAASASASHTSAAGTMELAIRQLHPNIPKCGASGRGVYFRGGNDLA